MRKFYQGLILFSLSLGLSGCAKPVTDDVLIMNLENRFNKIKDQEKLQQEVEWSWKDLKSREIPAVGDSHAIFLYRGPAKEVRLAGDFTGWQPGPHLVQLGKSDIFALSLTFPDSARLEYKFIVDGKWMLDPSNLRHARGGFGENSELRMPRYRPAPSVEPRPEVTAGTLDSLIFSSSILGSTRPIKIYLPAGYVESGKRYPTLYLHDGFDYIQFARVHIIADNLIADASIVPLLIVCVPPISPEERAKEYGNNARFADFFVKELVPFIHSRYRVLDEPQQRAICGPSFGGLASFYVALRAPQVFGKIAAQSSYFGFDAGAIFKMAEAVDVSRYEFYFHCGTYESSINGTGINLVELNRQMCTVLAAKGARFTYSEYPAGHSWGYWRDEMPRILQQFFGV